MPFRIEIWSDVVCPWCYIGKRRFETALAGFPHRDETVVEWRSFELDPEAERDPDGTAAERLAGKYGMSVEEAAARQAQLAKLAAEDGLEYHFDRVRGGNSFDAHRLVHLAAASGLQDAAQERLMRAHFTEGERIGDRETLARLGAELGLDDAAAMLETDRFADEVRADEALAHQLNIHGVPYFVLDRHYGVSGAQPADVLRQALERAWEDRREAA
jgi:predicted DsbA family dithiol-disulfide isomerase